MIRPVLERAGRLSLGRLYLYEADELVGVIVPADEAEALDTLRDWLRFERGAA